MYHEPFSAIIEREQAEARARLQAQKERSDKLASEAEASRRKAAHERAIKDLTDERIRESQLVRAARDSAIVLLNNVGQVAAGMTVLGKQVRKALERRANSEEEITFSEANSVVALMNRLATSLRQGSDAGQKAMEMTRLLLGEPTSIMGVQHLESISVEEARQRIASSQRAIESLAEAGITMIDGNTNAIDHSGSGGGGDAGDVEQNSQPEDMVH
jgi:hypothetical protein